MLGLFSLLALHLAIAQGTPSSKKALFLEPSSTPIPGGKASLTIGVLTRRAETYIGDYQFQVSPFFFKNEKGKLSIDVSDATLEKLANGVAVEFSGQATTSGSGKTRRIHGKATPSDDKGGTVKLRFMAGKRQLLFTTTYRFGEPFQ